jgi:hypothetical protein
MNEIAGPHRKIACAGVRERFLTTLFDRMWDQYRQRVSYVRDYERVVAQAGAQFINDHIAFRTIATQQPMAGIASVARIFEAAGYAAAGNYLFDDKHLSAVHYQHSNQEFPKLFVSELRTWELPDPARKIIGRITGEQRSAISTELLAAISELDVKAEGADFETLLADIFRHFSELPWMSPESSDVRMLNEYSQYGAWVAVHGYAVNHFTALVNSHGVESLNDLEKTIAALRAAGVPLKAEIEGLPGSKLRQSATEAVVLDVEARQNGAPVQMEWTYAYFELAERNPITDPETGRQVAFQGFLGPQATNLFEMTKK